MQRMHFDLGSVPAWVAAGISAIFGIQSWLSSRRSKQAGDAAGRQAERACEAAEKAVAAQGEIAAETKRVAELSRTDPDANRHATERNWEAVEENPWQIVRDDEGDRLCNLTATTKYHVRLRGGPARLDGQNFFYEIAGNDSAQVDLLEPWRILADKTVIVSWHSTNATTGEPKQQRIHL